MLTAAICFLTLAAPADYRKDLNTFMAAERAFARTCALQGMRASFIQWFAPDAIGFTPHPVKQREEFEKMPEEKPPFASLLSWEPKIADCSSKADLGFTTGPYKLIDMAGKKPISHGAYFSIWRKQKDGQLKVVLDLGTPMDEAPAFPMQMKVPGPPSPALVTMDMVDRAKALIKASEEDIAKSNAEEVPKTIRQLYDARPIVYRAGSGPIQTSAEAVTWWTDAKLSLKEWTIEATEVAESADLAYCYGKYVGEKDGKETTGYFVHVWKCQLGKGWHIVADAMTAISPEK